MPPPDEVTWPPRSPQDVLLSTPGGRRRLQQLRDTSPSPSPRKRGTVTPSFRQRAQALAKQQDDEEEDGEDEETLQLQIAAIEAKIKLKKLQQAKAKAGNDAGNDGRRTAEPFGVSSRQNPVSPGKQLDTLRRMRSVRSAHDIQVPLSPPPPAKRPDPVSPSRVLLGIDKGLRGRDVSLRRPPSMRNFREQTQSSQSVSRTQSTRETSVTSRLDPAFQEDRPKSFSERIAESRASDKMKQERTERLLKTRSKGFGLAEEEVEQFKRAATSREVTPPPARRTEFGRNDVVQAATGPSAGQEPKYLRKSRSVSNLKRNSQLESSTSSSSSKVDERPMSNMSLRPPSLARENSHEGDSVTSQGETHFDSYSGQHLSKRLIPHTALTRTLASKTIYTIPDLFKIVKAPTYEPPDIDNDFVIFATIASKSAPKDRKDSVKTKNEDGKDGDNKSKFMAMTLTDLKWTLDLYLFTTAFSRFWKLTPGTVIAILNPGIMAPPANQANTGRFSLTLNSSDDTVLEIGTARDLGWCKSIKRDGKPCTDWVDLRHTEFCSFHIDATLKKAKAGRMEVNTITAPFGGTSSGRGGKSGFFQTSGRGAGRGRGRGINDGPINPIPQRFGGAGAKVFMHPTGLNGRSAASLIDDDDVDPDAFHMGASKEERLRRRLAAREKERETQRKLGEVLGGGLGAEYMRRVDRPGPAEEGEVKAFDSDKMDVDLEDLRGGRAVEVKLSPVRNTTNAVSKRKRLPSRTDGSEGTSTGPGIGWAGAFNTSDKSALKRWDNSKGERLGGGGNGVERASVADSSGTEIAEAPMKKKTRFVTARGFKIAGRESFGVPAVELEDDDGLDII